MDHKRWQQFRQEHVLILEVEELNDHLERHAPVKHEVLILEDRLKELLSLRVQDQPCEPKSHHFYGVALVVGRAYLFLIHHLSVELIVNVDAWRLANFDNFVVVSIFDSQDLFLLHQSSLDGQVINVHEEVGVVD